MKPPDQLLSIPACPLFSPTSGNHYSTLNFIKKADLMWKDETVCVSPQIYLPQYCQNEQRLAHADILSQNPLITALVAL